ncbi:MAG: glycosyltransferase family 4 protein [Sandaracinaceae bacterium]|nr:glycosyltransferase family 4 protein [Sandaracinaceae bacterium]
MATVVLVSKPLGPPWNDGSKNLARDVAEGLRRHSPRVFLPHDATWRPRRGGQHVLGPRRAQVAMLAHLGLGPPADLWHFFFAPNPRTSTVARALKRLRGTPTVHTVCSRPRDLAGARRLLFADRTVVLSKATEAALRDAGAPVHRIPPCAPDLSVPSAAERREARAALGLPLDAPLVVYPGDLEHGEGATRMLAALANLDDDARLVMACRAKSAAAAAEERRLRARTDPRVHWLGETPHILQLLGAADVVALPSSDLYAKVDLPLVLLEAMRLGRPVLVADDAPARELAEGGGALAVPPHAEAIGSAIADLLADDAAREALGGRARAVTLERYDAAAMAGAYERLYDELLGGAP